MACTTCTRAKSVPVCTQTLTLGTIASLNAAVWIYVKDITTDRIERFAGQSNGAGLVTLDMDLVPTYYQEDHTYEISVALQSAVSIHDTKDITISGTAYDCLQVRFEEVSNDADGWYPYQNITVEIES